MSVIITNVTTVCKECAIGANFGCDILLHLQKVNVHIKKTTKHIAYICKYYCCYQSGQYLNLLYLEINTWPPFALPGILAW